MSPQRNGFSARSSTAPLGNPTPMAASNRLARRTEGRRIRLAQFLAALLDVAHIIRLEHRAFTRVSCSASSSVR